MPKIQGFGGKITQPDGRRAVSHCFPVVCTMAFTNYPRLKTWLPHAPHHFLQSFQRSMPMVWREWETRTVIHWRRSGCLVQLYSVKWSRRPQVLRRAEWMARCQTTQFFWWVKSKLLWWGPESKSKCLCSHMYVRVRISLIWKPNTNLICPNRSSLMVSSTTCKYVCLSGGLTKLET